MMIAIHDDDCDEPLDEDGECPTCLVTPKMQSITYRKMTPREIEIDVEGKRTFYYQSMKEVP